MWSKQLVTKYANSLIGLVTIYLSHFAYFFILPGDAGAPQRLPPSAVAELSWLACFVSEQHDKQRFAQTFKRNFADDPPCRQDRQIITAFGDGG